MRQLRQRMLAMVAEQLGHPHGLLSPVIAGALNRGNGRAIADAVAAADVQPGATVADIGFGGGIGLRLLLDRVGDRGVVYGIEMADDMLRLGRSRMRGDVESGRLRLVHGTLTALPFPDRFLDAAITLNTVYFVADLDTVCAELARVLRPGGTVVVGIGDPDVMAGMPVTAYGFALRPVTDIAAGLQRAGLRVEQRRIDGKPLPRHLIVGRTAGPRAS